MITKKVCILGAFSVGKTSLINRFVHSLFSDDYLSTVGVKISKKELTVNSRELAMIFWDLEGKDEFSDVRVSYLRGAMGVFLVADGTRRETVKEAGLLHDIASTILGDVPKIMLVNKTDLSQDWEVTAEDLHGFEARGLSVIKTSAKTGQNVNEAFHALCAEMLERDNAHE